MGTEKGEEIGEKLKYGHSLFMVKTKVCLV